MVEFREYESELRRDESDEIVVGDYEDRLALRAATFVGSLLLAAAFLLGLLVGFLLG